MILDATSTTAIIVSLVATTYYLKAQIDGVSKRLDDLVRYYDNRIEDVEKRLDLAIGMLQKRINGLEKGK